MKESDGVIGRQYKTLARAVIKQAVYDFTTELNKNKVGKNHKQDAAKFLDNSDELAFYSDLGDCRNDMIRLGYMREEI